jgi:hypothetical protein
MDPDWFLVELRPDLSEKKIGIRALISRIRDEFPDVGLGYFNPPLD